MRGSAAALRNVSQTCSTDSGVWFWRIGIGMSAGKRSGTSPSRSSTSVDPSATLAGRLANEPAKRATAKTKTSSVRPQSRTPINKPIRKFFIACQKYEQPILQRAPVSPGLPGRRSRQSLQQPRRPPKKDPLNIRKRVDKEDEG